MHDLSSYALMRFWIGAAVLAMPSTPVMAQTAPTDTADAVRQAMENGRRLTGLRTVADCRAEAAATGDIVVCGRMQNHSLPVPELIGPQLVQTDGAAVDPQLHCSHSMSGCFSGVDLPALLGAGIGIAQLLIDPDRDLGEGTPIPQRFRGANR